MGRKAEDGLIDSRYRLAETPLSDYAQRTAWNVRDSDGTVIFTLGSELSGGSKLTAEFALKHGRPCLHLAAGDKHANPAALLRQFIIDHGIRVLNVAGSRASKEPVVGEYVRRTLTEAILDHEAS